MKNKFEINIEHDFINPSLLALLQAHKDHCEAETPIESCHRLEVDAMRAPSLFTWVAWAEEEAVGIAAIKEINPIHGEVKSMHVRKDLRGTALAGLLFAEVLSRARSMRYQRLSLETGASPNFLPAVRFYEKQGFTRCGFFEGYKDDINSVFMSLTL